MSTKSSASTTVSKRSTKPATSSCWNERATRLVLRHQAGDADALDELARVSRETVLYLARRLKRIAFDVPFEDVHSEVLIALVESAQRYDATRGVRFSTVLHAQARWRVLRYVRDLSRMIRYSCWKQERGDWSECPVVVLESDYALPLYDDVADGEGHLSLSALGQKAFREWREESVRSVGDTPEWQVVAAGLECAAIGDSPRYISDALDIHRGLGVARRIRHDLLRYLHHDHENGVDGETLSDLGCWPVCRCFSSL